MTGEGEKAVGVDAWPREGDYVEKLIRALCHPRALKRREAAWLLGWKREIRAVDPLIEVLRGRDDPYVEAAVAEALGRIGDERAVDPLISALKSSFLPVRCRAAEALGRIGSRKALGPMKEALKDQPSVRVLAGEAIRKIEGT
jgi:HEAT repeat protein